MDQLHDSVQIESEIDLLGYRIIAAVLLYVVIEPLYFFFPIPFIILALLSPSLTVIKLRSGVT